MLLTCLDEGLVPQRQMKLVVQRGKVQLFQCSFALVLIDKQLMVMGLELDALENEVECAGLFAKV